MLFSEENGDQKTWNDRNAVNAEYSTSFKEGVFQAIFIKLDINEEVEENIYFVMKEIGRSITALGEMCEEHVTAETHSGMMVLFNYKIEKEELFQKKIEILYENLRRYMEQFKGFSVVIGVGIKTNNFYSSAVCLKTAMDAIKYRIKLHDAGIIYYEKYLFTKYEIEDVITDTKRQNYLLKIEAGDISGAQEELLAMIRKIRYGQDNYSPVLIYDVLITYVSILTEYCKKINLYDRIYEENLKKWNRQVDSICSEKALVDTTMNFIRVMMSHIAEEIKEKEVKPIRIVKKYIEENFMQEISLTSLAELVDMNASYLSSVFKKETGMMYSEYLMQCRMKKAMQLLVDTNKSIGEIAGESGYQDARYFSKQFLKLVGLKPSEYRKLYS